MTKNEIIKKGEKQLEFILNKLESGEIQGNEVSITAQRGLAQLDMLFYILDEEPFDMYDKWFDKFMIYR